MASIANEYPSGVVVYQVTDEPQLKNNIYCEVPYSPLDSNCFVYQRLNPDKSLNAYEYVAVDLRTWERRVIQSGRHFPCLSLHGELYSIKEEASRWRLICTNVATAESRDVFAGAPPCPRALMSLSPDQRYLAYNVHYSYDPPLFGVERVDLDRGEREIICEASDIYNAHVQFEPSEGRYVLVQQNRGCRFSPEGQCLRMVGPEGATLFLLDMSTGERIPLAIGHPHTSACSGHQAWIGNTKEIILTVNANDGFTQDAACILAVRAHEPHRVVSSGRRATHVGASPCGRFYTADIYDPDEIVIGSSKSGKVVVVCQHHASWDTQTFGQSAHPHPYLTPDLKWVIFNSDRTGIPQIYAASIPPELLAHLELV